MVFSVSHHHPRRRNLNRIKLTNLRTDRSVRRDWVNLMHLQLLAGDGVGRAVAAADHAAGAQFGDDGVGDQGLALAGRTAFSSMCARYSSSKWRMVESTGDGANWPSAQSDPLSMPSAMLDLLQICQRALALGDAFQHLQHPGGADTAGRALAAALVAGELDEKLGEFHHAGGLVGHDHAAGPHHRARRLQRIEIHRHVQILLRQTAAQRPARLHGLEFFAEGDAAADVVDDLAHGDAHRHLDQAGAVDHAGESEHRRARTLFCAQTA